MQKIKSFISGVFQVVIGAIILVGSVGIYRSTTPEFYTEHCPWSHYLSFPTGCVMIAVGNDGRTLIQHSEMGFGEYSLEITNFNGDGVKFYVPEDILPLTNLGYSAELIDGTYNEVRLDGLRFELDLKPETSPF